MTLVEVVVACSIFAMIMLAVVTAMSTFGKGHERLQRQSKETAQKREVDRFLRQALRSALPQAGGFDGAGNWVRWIAPIDRVGSAGGLQHLRLESRGESLVLDFAPYDRLEDPQKEPEWGSIVDSFQLIKELREFRVAYRMRPGSPWMDSLSAGETQNLSTRLPWAVKLEIASLTEVWPPVIVALEQHGGNL